MVFPFAKRGFRRRSGEWFEHQAAARGSIFITIHTFGGRGSPS
jgi:hypothetical protein